MTHKMKKQFNLHAVLTSLFLMVALSASSSAIVQEKRPGSDNVLGAVTVLDATGHTVTVKTDQGVSVVIKTDDKTALLRVPAGQTSLSNAATIQFSDIASGDRVLARGVTNGDKTQLDANRLIVLSKSDLETLHKQELDDWRKRGIYGVVKQVNAAENKLDVETRVGATTARIMVSADKAGVMRYAQDSLNFADAKSATLASIKEGDQLRALGEKSADGKAYTAEKLIFGSFQTIGVTIVEVDAANNLAKAQTLDKKKPITLVFTKESVLHRIPQMMAMGIARRLMPPDEAQGPPATNGQIQNARPTGGTQGGAPNGAQGRAPGGATGEGSQGPRPQMDIQTMLDALPNLQITDLKAGDVLAVATSVGSDDTRVTAIKSVAGMDAVLQAVQAAAARRQQSVSLSSGLPSGFDFGAIQP